jgi:hypothetical protein
VTGVNPHVEYRTERIERRITYSFGVNVDQTLIGYMSFDELTWKAVTRTAEANRPSPDEMRRADWDEKHARCDGCGQFLQRAAPRPSSELDRLLDPAPRWVSHYVQDYWGEWDHR